MDGNKRNFLKKLSSPQFKIKGGSKRANRNYANRETSSEKAQASDTVYHVLCQSKRIGGVIGKGGYIIRSLREDTQAKITVTDSVRGSDERVIIISSPSTKLVGSKSSDNSNENQVTGEESEGLEPHCAAQDALLKVHDRIVEEELGGAADENKEIEVTTRLLVANNLVGCLLGKKGDVIQKLRSETGASIRVLSADHLPACAMASDELVQISGKPGLVKKALYEVSTLLHQNPRKDKPPMSFPMAHGAQGFHPPGHRMENMLPPGNSAWSRRSTNLNSLPPVVEMGGYGDQPPGMGHLDFDYAPPPYAKEAPTDFTMKILCSAAKIGGVIGKGGIKVKQLEQETGASINVEDVSPESDERVILVSSLEALWDPRSQTIDAILLLQHNASEISDKGIITTRLLLPSSKVGCILGQGGQVINEMRRRTRADIRVFPKDDKPKSASMDEELVQISGSFGAAKAALVEISKRFRERCLRGANGNIESASVRPLPRFGPSTDIPTGDPRPLGVMRAGSSSGYEHMKGGVHEYDSSSYPDFPGPARYPTIRSSHEMKVPNNSYGSASGTRGYNFSEVAGNRPRFQDPHSVGPGYVDDIRGSSERFHAGQNAFQGFGSSGQSGEIQQGAYHHSYNAQQSGHQGYNAQQSGYQDYKAQGSYPSISPSQLPYQNSNPHQAPYGSVNAQQQPPYQHPYQNTSAQGPYHPY